MKEKVNLTEVETLLKETEESGDESFFVLGIEENGYAFERGPVIKENENEECMFAELSSKCLNFVQMEQYTFDSQGYGESAGLWEISGDVKRDDIAYGYRFPDPSTMGGFVLEEENIGPIKVIKGKKKFRELIAQFEGEEEYTKIIEYIFAPQIKKKAL